MPAILTHNLFGEGVSDDALDLLGLRSTDERDAFILGNQGPDPLFYLVVDPLMSKWSPLGSVMHSSRPAQLLCAMREAAERVEGRGRTVARAYVAGFACHWLLDSSTHPFVYSWQNAICSAGVPGLDERDASKVHAEIERDLDEMVLYTLVGQTVERYRPHERALKASPFVLSVIDKIYFYVALWVYGRPIDPRTFSTAALEFRLVQTALDSPGGRKRALLGAAERLVRRTPHSLLYAMSHRARPETTSDFDNREGRAWENPFTGARSTATFWDVYEDAQTRALGMLAELFSPGFGLAAARELTGDLNFEGAPAAPDGAFLWE